MNKLIKMVISFGETNIMTIILKIIQIKKISSILIHFQQKIQSYTIYQLIKLKYLRLVFILTKFFNNWSEEGKSK